MASNTLFEHTRAVELPHPETGKLGQLRPTGIAVLAHVAIQARGHQVDSRVETLCPHRGRVVGGFGESPGRRTRRACRRPDDPVTSRAEPSLDWYAEHERCPESQPLAVRCASWATTRPIAQLEGILAGFELRVRTVHGLAAKASSSPDGPRVVLLPVASGYTVMRLSYELSLDELIEWSNALRAVDEVGWVARGGVIPP